MRKASGRQGKERLKRQHTAGDQRAAKTSPNSAVDRAAAEITAIRARPTRIRPAQCRTAGTELILAGRPRKLGWTQASNSSAPPCKALRLTPPLSWFCSHIVAAAQCADRICSGNQAQSFEPENGFAGHSQALTVGLPTTTNRSNTVTAAPLSRCPLSMWSRCLPLF